ncbi:MAG: hypothetical protein ACUVYA_20450 [Planctomycetota bacterium]
MKHLTIRDIPPALARALEKEKKRRGTSLNRTVIELLSHGLGVDREGVRRNGLKNLAGSWSPEDQARFDAAVGPFEAVDEGLWR